MGGRIEGELGHAHREVLLFFHSELYVGGKGHGGLYKAPEKEERRKRKAKRETKSISLILDLNDGKL